MAIVLALLTGTALTAAGPARAGTGTVYFTGTVAHTGGVGVAVRHR